MKKSILLLFAALLPLVASAHDFAIGGIYYNITSKTDKTVEVTYKGDSYASYNNEYSGSITIPATVTRNGVVYSVTSIGDEAFSWCRNLTSITIPEGVTSIGFYAFYGCSSLTSITIPESMTSIGFYAFSLCSSLTSITIPEDSKLTSIGVSAFDYCSSLTTINIPEGVTSIGGSAFYGCSSLTAITIPEGVTSIEESAFSGCSSLTDITVSSKNSVYDSRNNCNAIIETNSNTLIAGCSSTIIPEGVTSIGGSAFRGCSSLTTINIPEDVTSIGNYAFYECSSLTAITIPEGVTSIGDLAFYGCSSLTAITIPEGVTSIGGFAFYSCSGLTSITIPEGVTSIGAWAFSRCSNLTTINIPESVTSIGESAFRDCSRLTAINIPAGVTSIGEDAFNGCSSLERVTINCANVGSWFSGLSSIKEFVLGESVRSIEQGAFSGCSSLESLHIAPNVDSYGSEAFAGCTAIKELTVMGNVMPEIPSENITSITLYSPIPLETTEFAAMVYRNAMLNIPKGSLTRYGNADVWKNFWYINGFDPKEGKDIFLTINQADNGEVGIVVDLGRTYKVRITAFEGWKIHAVTFNGEEVTAQLTEEGTFTTPALQADAVLNIAYEKTDNNTMVANTTARAIKVQGHRGTLRITGTTQGEAISVYTIGGTLVAQESAEGDETLITLPTGQVYIVKVADKVVKIGM